MGELRIRADHRSRASTARAVEHPDAIRDGASNNGRQSQGTRCMCTDWGTERRGVERSPREELVRFPHAPKLPAHARSSCTLDPHASPLGISRLELVRSRPAMGESRLRRSQDYATSDVSESPQPLAHRRRTDTGLLSAHSTMVGESHGSGEGLEMGRSSVARTVAIGRAHCQVRRAIPRAHHLFCAIVARCIVPRDIASDGLGTWRSRKKLARQHKDNNLFWFAFRRLAFGLSVDAMQ